MLAFCSSVISWWGWLSSGSLYCPRQGVRLLSLIAHAPHLAGALLLQLRKEVARLADAEDRSADAQAELQAAKQDAARLQGQLEAKSRHITTLEAQLAAARDGEAAGAAGQQQLKQELASAKAEAQRLRGQLGEAERLQQQLQQLQDQLAEVGRREAAALAQKSAMQQEVNRLAGQVGDCSHANHTRVPARCMLQQKPGGCCAPQPKGSTLHHYMSLGGPDGCACLGHNKGSAAAGRLVGRGLHVRIAALLQGSTGCDVVQLDGCACLWALVVQDAWQLCTKLCTKLSGAPGQMVAL